MISDRQAAISSRLQRNIQDGELVTALKECHKITDDKN